jgi:beta-N-acetylhexosaminidase
MCNRTLRLSRREFLKLAGLGIATTTLLNACGQPTATPLPPQTPTPLDYKIAQMLLLGFRGLTVDENHPIVQDIRRFNIGGVILFDYDVPNNSPVRNIQSPEQVKALIAALQAAASTPLLIAIDQEGGQIQRLKTQFGFPSTVSHQYLGTLDDLAVTREQAGIIAQTLRQVGINMNLAPVVDVNVNPNNPVIGRLERSFSSDPAVVAKHALAYIQAHHDHRVLCTLKHFPGHGSSTRDSHKGMVDVSETWSEIELEPYRRIIDAGKADAIMTAHVFNANLDPEHPATLSRPTVWGVLRQELDYKDVVISDDLEMRAITSQYDFETAVEAAVRAGVDVLLFANNTKNAQEEGLAARVIGLIRKLVREGKITEERIEWAYRRIQRLKGKLHR